MAGLVVLAGCANHARVADVRADVRVTVREPGASAAELERTVAIPLERALLWAPIRTTVRDGVVTLDLAGADPSRVTASIAAKLDLPPDAQPPIVDRLAGQRLALRYVATAPHDPIAVMTEKHTELYVALMQQAGVTRIDVCGARPMVRVLDVDAVRMDAVGASPHAIRQAVEAADPTEDALPDVVIGGTAERPVRLRDIANIHAEPARDGCLAFDHQSGVIVGSVFTASGRVQVPTAPEGLTVRVVPADSVELTVERVEGADREHEIDMIRRIVGDAIVEDDGELRVIVPASAVAGTLEALRMEGRIARAPAKLVVGIMSSDRSQLASAAEIVAQALGTHADGTLGLAMHDVTRLEPARGDAAAAAVDAFRATTDEGLRLATKTPTSVHVNDRDPLFVRATPTQRLGEVTTIAVVREARELRRVNGVPWVGVRATGTADEVAAALARVKLPSGVFSRLERAAD